MNIKNGLSLSCLLVLAGLCAAASSGWTPQRVTEYVADWPTISRLEAAALMEKYGVPDEILPDSLVWGGRGDWSRTTLNRSVDFTQRSGILEQSVLFAVPVERWDDLNALDLGISYSPDEGTLSASSEKEEINVLALNVAVDVIRGRRTVSAARDFYQQTLDLAASGKASRYTRGLLFSPDKLKIKRRPHWVPPLMP